mgnify:CR=1 FL=1
MNRPTPSILVVALSLLFSLGTGLASAQSEYVIVSGGPALRQWENMRKPGEQHDRWWGNFVRTARVRIEEIKKQAAPGTIITWMVYQDAYVRRAGEDKQPLTSHVTSVRDKYGVRLVWFRSGDDVINYINNGMGRGRIKVSGFEYFGHSNKFCFMFDYSSDIYGVSSSFLHEADLKRLHRSAFARDAYCKSWGCHTGESMSTLWKKATGVRMIGAFGKTDYSDMHLRNWHVGLSPGAHWRTG